MILSVSFCVVLFCAIIYLAVSRSSDFKIRLAALAAMAAMIVTVIICLFKIFIAPPVTEMQAYPDMPAPEAAPPSNPMALVLFIIVLIALFLVVLFISFQEHRRTSNKGGGLGTAPHKDNDLAKLGL